VADFIVALEHQELGLNYPERYKQQIGKVTAADVQRVAAKFFVPETFNRVVVGNVQ
jgi:predicted Zn-dependent peptidase